MSYFERWAIRAFTASALILCLFGLATAAVFLWAGFTGPALVDFAAAGLGLVTYAYGRKVLRQNKEAFYDG